MDPRSEAVKKSGGIPLMLSLDDGDGESAKPKTPASVKNLMLAMQRRRKTPKEAFDNLRSAGETFFKAQGDYEMR